MFPADNSADSLGKQVIKNSKLLLKLLIGLDFIPINMLAIR